MTRSQPEELEDFLRRQSPDALVGVLLELASGDEAVQQRLEGRLDQVAHELLPRDPERALDLFEAFIEFDTRWFESADDSDGLIGDTVRTACARAPAAVAGGYTFTAASRVRIPYCLTADQYDRKPRPVEFVSPSSLPSSSTAEWWYAPDPSVVTKAMRTAPQSVLMRACVTGAP